MKNAALTIELSTDSMEKLALLKQCYERRSGAILSESALIESLIAKEFIQKITPFDLGEYMLDKEQL
ncbi:MAG: DUF3924 family protein [Ectobacillus sp.]